MICRIIYLKCKTFFQLAYILSLVMTTMTTMTRGYGVQVQTNNIRFSLPRVQICITYGRHSLILGYWVADLRAWPEAAKVVRGGWRPPRLRWMPIGIHDGVMLLPMGQSFIAQDCHAIISTCWLAGLRAWPEASEVVSSGCRSFRLSWMPSRAYARVLLLEQYLLR